MNDQLIYIGADTPALKAAQHYLEAADCHVTLEPSNEVTHLLLSTPTFAPDGSLVGGQDLNALLRELPSDTTIIGGNISVPIFQNYPTIDLLRNESYLASNAAITAECALQVAYNRSPDTMKGTPILILGWGRIGKCLAKLLSAIGADVNITARKETDLAMITALGYTAVPYYQILPHLPRYHIIFNTVPIMILPEALSNQCRKDCVKIDLASSPGIGGSNVVTARGLPGKLAPEASGRLIAKSVLELCFKKEVLP